MLKKEVFIRAIEALDNQIKKDFLFAEKLSLEFPNCYVANLMPDNKLLSDSLISVLQYITDDNEICVNGYSWITYFCFELDFGRKNNELKVYSNKKEVTLSNASQLYDFILTLKN